MSADLRGAGSVAGAGSRRLHPSVAGVDSLNEVRARLLAGASPGRLDGLPDRARRAVALATETGAPAVPALQAAMAAIRDLEERDRAITVATSQGRLVAAGMLGLPVLAVPGLARLLDLDLLAFYGTGPGLAVATVALGLLATGGVLMWRIMRRAGVPATRRRPLLAALTAAVSAGLIGGIPAALAAVVATVAWHRRSRSPAPPAPGTDEVCDLVATALTAGLSAGAALRQAARHLPAQGAVLHRLAYGLELDRPVALPSGLDRLGAVVTAAARWGAAAAPPLRHLAADLRADEHARALAAAERLPALLTFPTALCLLPASVLLIGAPVIASGLAATSTAGL